MLLLSIKKGTNILKSQKKGIEKQMLWRSTQSDRNKESTHQFPPPSLIAYILKIPKFFYKDST